MQQGVCSEVQIEALDREASVEMNYWWGLDGENCAKKLIRIPI